MGCPEKLKQTAYFSLIRSFMEYGAIVWGPHTSTTVTKLRGCSVKLQGLSKVGIQDTLVFLICLMCWGGHLFLRGDRMLDLFCFTKLLTVWHMKFRQIGHTTSQYRQSIFPKTICASNGLAFAEALSLAVFRSNFL